MTRQEFIEQLRIALQGTISQDRLNEHLRYYDNYIMEEARKGRTEEQVVEDLGDPRLIAKTLTTAEASRQAEEPYRQGRQRADSSRGRQEHGGPGHSQGASGQGTGSGFSWNSWYGKLVLIAIAVLIVVVIAQVVAFLLPIVIPVVLILLLLSFFLGGRK